MMACWVPCKKKGGRVIHVTSLRAEALVGIALHLGGDRRIRQHEVHVVVPALRLQLRVFVGHDLGWWISKNALGWVCVTNGQEEIAVLVLVPIPS